MSISATREYFMIKYFFTSLGDGKTYEFDIDLQRPIKTETQTNVFWTELDYNKCPNCTLNSETNPQCPVAVDLKEIIVTFSGMKSIDKYEVKVVTPLRTYMKDCDLQVGLQSLIGLVMATSHCPVFRKMRGLAEFHLPFASVQENMFRIAGFYLIQQYYRHRKQSSIDMNLTGLGSFQKEMLKADNHFFARIREASESDANLNALVSWSSTSMLMSRSLEAMMSEQEKIFLEDD